MNVTVTDDIRYSIQVIDESPRSVEIIKDERNSIEIVNETTLVVKLAGVINVGQASGSGNTVNVVAAEALGGHRVITMQGGYADSGNAEHAYAVAGITLQAVGSGITAIAQTSGPLTESSWNWTMGQPVYLGSTGQLTQTPPAAGFWSEIGRPINATTLLIDIQPSIILN